MEERYLRNLGALTRQEILALREKTVFIAGCGGLGGYLLEYLLRLGVGHIRAADGDCFEPSNLNRQLLSSPALLGTQKAEAAMARAAEVNPEADVRVWPMYLTRENAAQLLAGCDAALDGLDNPEARRVLSEACSASGIPLIHGAIHGWTAQAGISSPGDGMMERLYADDADGDKASLAFTPPFCAAVQTALCVRLLTGRPIESGTVYYMDLLNMEWESLRLE